jgi:hypothetical protein
MTLKNGYKVIYEVIENREGAGKTRVFKASKTGVFADAEVIGEAKIGEYKLIYEKDGKIYGSTSGIPSDDTANDFCFEDFEKVFTEVVEDDVTDEEDNNGSENGDNTPGSDAGSDSSTTTPPEDDDENTSTDPDNGNGTESGDENGNDAGEGTETDTELSDPDVDPDSTPEGEENE